MGVFKTITHRVQFCVVGGGLAGLCAAVEAARRGLKVALMQDRPMLGGNASSEVRMWIMGAKGRNNQETGIIEEILLNNYYRNPYKNFSIWDSIIWEIARFEKNITLILNCSCLDAEVKEGRVVSVTGWQTTTQMYHTVEAPLFADCSGDSVLAPLTGAEYRVGHEARAEFGEDIAPVYADKKTMGMSILIQARETSGPKTYIPPVWAEKFTKELLPHRLPDLKNGGENFWYLELGGVRDSIADTEELRDELLAVAYGIWDFVKNDTENKEKFANFDLEWIGFLPGKRESRRYVGDHILTQNDVREGGKFDDIVAYGGWPMDDHHPEALRTPEEPTIFHPAPSPFGIPYRCLYSRNIENLFCAGRNISTSHVALSSTRVMSTCGILGQAVGAAAAAAIRHGETPRGVYRNYLGEVQQTLMEDDCWLPGLCRKPSKLTAEAKLASSKGNAEVLRNGHDRPIENEDNGLSLAPGEYAEYTLAKPARVSRARFVFDSDLNRDTQHEGIPYKWPMYATYYLDTKATYVPKTMTKAFSISLTLADGTNRVIKITDNHQRLVYVDIGAEVSAVRYEPVSTWGNAESHIFSFELL
ncbi:hypothetical protein FACS1894109_15760 [Spirochaetia bacterium]|nr:hypothetical protein FACS1894109_15760 [Spirochaetia bacterium]